MAITLFGKLVTIPEKIISEIPLPNFFSVINSPIKMMTNDAAVKIKIFCHIMSRDAKVMIPCDFRMLNIPNACNMVSGNAKYFVQLSNLRRPSSPFS